MADGTPATARDYDAVVVGAGAGGAAAAWAMTQRGWHVLLLDAGPAWDPANEYTLARTDWERRGFPYKTGSQGDVRFGPLQAFGSAGADGRPPGDDAAPGDGIDLDNDPDLAARPETAAASSAGRSPGLRSWSRGQGRNRATARQPSGPGYHHVRGIGGSTLHFTGEAHRLHPHAFALHSAHGVGADWPLDYTALEPWYLQAERLLGVAGPAQTGPRWRSAPYPLPAHPLSLASQRLGEGARALGIDWGANARCALSLPYDGRPPCNYCGGCNAGCPRGDKGSADVTFVAKAAASGLCDVRPLTTLLDMHMGGARRVSHITVVDAAGVQARVRTRRLVLACGAIETPRLLLLHAPLANAHGVVGKHLLETVSWTSIGHAEDASQGSLRSYGGLPADAISWHHNAPDAVPGVIGGFRLGAAIHESGLVGPIAHAQRAIAGFGHAHKAALRATLGSLVAVGAIGESLPNDGTYVDLDPTDRDAFGRPLARIHSRLDADALQRLRAMARATRGLLAASRITTLVEEYGTADYFSSTHVFGTCRMGKDPRTSVVDADLRVHGVDNVHVCDASVFPSSGGGEAPTLTLQALVLRAVARMR